MSQYDRYASKEEIARVNAYATANEVRQKQQQHAKYIRMITNKLERMDNEQLAMINKICRDIKDYQTFFDVIRKI